MVDKDEAYRSWERGFAGPRPTEKQPATFAEVGDREDPTLVTVVTTDSEYGQLIPAPKKPMTPKTSASGKGKKRGS